MSNSVYSLSFIDFYSHFKSVINQIYASLMEHLSYTKMSNSNGFCTLIKVNILLVKSVFTKMVELYVPLCTS
uniref:Uncharacterized protein n=1 Tax=Aegilops tauschii subsp. strangulata TaxID=200361 RepID=A0A453GIH3_AEGTS